MFNKTGYFRNLEGVTNHLDALRKIEADFPIVKRDLFYKDKNGNDVLVPYHVATVNEDNDGYLGVVGRNYGLEQYAKECEILSDIVEHRVADFVSGCLTSGGARLRISMTDNQKVILWDGLQIQNYYVVLTSKDNSARFKIDCMPMEVSTGTVLTLPESFHQHRRKHSKYFSTRLLLDRGNISKANRAWQEFADIVPKLCAAQFTSDFSVEKYFEAVIPGETPQAKNTRDQIASIYLGGIHNLIPRAKGTLFGAFLAVAVYCDSEKTVKKSQKRDQISAEIEARLDGAGAAQKAEAFANIIKLAKMLKVC